MTETTPRSLPRYPPPVSSPPAQANGSPAHISHLSSQRWAGSSHGIREAPAGENEGDCHRRIADCVKKYSDRFACRRHRLTHFKKSSFVVDACSRGSGALIHASCLLPIDKHELSRTDAILGKPTGGSTVAYLGIRMCHNELLQVRELRGMRANEMSTFSRDQSTDIPLMVCSSLRRIVELEPLFLRPIWSLRIARVLLRITEVLPSCAMS
jgi:hypothetical protein